MIHIKKFLHSLFILSILSINTNAQETYLQSDEPPVIPVGEDAYLQWDKIPYQRIGVRAYMRSTYDREGNNRGADASHFLYQESDSFNVTLDVKGKGILYFKRTNHFHGSPWHYETDGNDFIVKETATDDPIDAKNKYKKTEFIPQELFPYPLTYTWSTTKGADLMWRPIPFNSSFRIAYGRTFYGTGYYIYHMFPNQISHVSKPISTWDRTAPDPKVLEIINKAGDDPLAKDLELKTISGQIELAPFEKNTLLTIDEKPSMIRSIKFSIPRDIDKDFGKCRLRIAWDHRWHASVDAPVDLFYGAGVLYNNNNREYLVKGLPLNIRYDEDSVYLSCYWPMPFFNNAQIELEERNGNELKGIHWEVGYSPYEDPINHVAYFHATYSDHEKPENGRDMTFLDTRVTEGGGDWSGNFVGMSWIFSERGELHTLEGDPRFFFDDSRTPQGWGTGTEEWGGGGDYWGGENMTIPFAGHPVGKAMWNDHKGELDLINSAYRFLIADYFPFGKRAVINIEHGGLNNYPEHYSGVVYWYGMDKPTLVLTDELNVCHQEDIKRHNYLSPSASEPYQLVSRYEWGPDHDVANWANPKDERELFYGARQYFPAEEDSVRTMKGTSSFSVKLDPENRGVMLRRKFDYAYPNQLAKVYVKDTLSEKWIYTGVWYTAGSNTCVYSRPKGRNFTEGELGPTEHNIIQGNRRWREEEFLIPANLTKGLNKLDIKIEFVPVDRELFPGQAFPEKNVWSESRYWVYCYKMPKVNTEFFNK